MSPPSSSDDPPPPPSSSTPTSPTNVPNPQALSSNQLSPSSPPSQQNPSPQPPSSPLHKTTPHILAQTLRSLGVTTIFGLVGIPIVTLADTCIAHGITFIPFRNEQAAAYAATAYGYLTGQPGVCLVVGGPGVLHAVSGVGNALVNHWPMMLLAGSCERTLVGRGAFQEMDALAVLGRWVKSCGRVEGVGEVGRVLRGVWGSVMRGRPGAGLVDLPADVVEEEIGEGQEEEQPDKGMGRAKVSLGGADEALLFKVVQVVKSAKAPLVVIGKGAAYARAEDGIRELVERTKIPFLPTPMGKGVVPDSHVLNAASARSTALKEADVVLVLGARLNWILHFGDSPKWNKNAKFIQVDIAAEEIGKNAGNPELGIVGDLNNVVPQLVQALDGWSYSPDASPYMSHLAAAKQRNEEKAARGAADPKLPMTISRACNVIKDTLEKLSPPDEGGIVYVAEGANTMDISRSIFSVSHPRLRLDAGTNATMGVGLGYAIAAHSAYNSSAAEGSSGSALRKKKIVCLEGDSAFGFSAMEVETMARCGMDVLIFVMNNGGIYHGDSDSPEDWHQKQQRHDESGLRSTSLGWEVGYEKIAEACGGLGVFVRTPEELAAATAQGYHEARVTVVNVIVESGKGQSLSFGWQASGGDKTRSSKL